MLHMEGDLLLVGCGRMGGALLDGWIAGGLSPAQVTIVEPFVEAHAPLQEKGCHCVSRATGIDAGLRPALVLFAVKPQMMAGVLPDYRRFVGPNSVFLSIAAGTKISQMEEALGPGTSIVRAMPNTPAAVGRGMSVLVANSATSAQQANLCEMLLAAVGETAQVTDEELLDAVTGVSGSGPAYVFYMVESMAAAGRAAGLEADLAMQLARATVSGAGELLAQAPESAEQLRKNVTSPNGTTQAALEVLMADDGLSSLMVRAVKAAADRSRELAN